MNSGCAAALDRLQDFCFMAIKAANREPCTPPRSTLILTPAFVVYTELGIDLRDGAAFVSASHLMHSHTAAVFTKIGERRSGRDYPKNCVNLQAGVE